MKRIFFAFLFFSFSIAATSLVAQTVPTPKEHFGFNIGDDYQLATYTQTEAYFKKLAAASDRTKLEVIGQTEEGRPQYMMIVSSPANISNLAQYKAIAQRLAHAEDLTDEQASALAVQGKAVVWIDGGLHATEVVGAHQLIETLYQIVSRKDAETMRILNDAIILFVHANPDGQELVSDWYMQEADVKKRNMNVPRLYQKYIGHDNNRDFFMINMKETQNISRQQYVEWMPQIIYNHHQTGPAGSVLAGPPYRDPFNYVYDPLLVTSIDAIGAAMNNRLNRENKPGYTQRAGAVFSTWWNGGLRTTAYYHNMVGLLTEIIGSPAPSVVPLVPQRLIPNGATPNPVVPQEWRFRRSIDYSVSLNYAVLNYAVNQKEELLFGIYRMGKNAIEKGGKDNWTLSPKMIDSVNKAFQKDDKSTGSRRDTMPVKYFHAVMKDPSLRDARGYIISAAQPDFPTAVKFINALIRSGIAVHKATAGFTVNGKQYPAGSYVIKTAQAFRPHLVDMFEPQDHPNDVAYPGGPPVRPYDAAGWTLAYSMGVEFDRVLENVDGPFEKQPYGELQTVNGMVRHGGLGYVLDERQNNAFIAVNDLLKAGVPVYRITAAKGSAGRQGSFYVPSSARAKDLLQKAADETGITVNSLSQKPASLKKISPLRIALWDQYGGSMPSGWVRWLMEQYHFPAQVIYTKEIDAGNLKKNYDLILFVDGAIPPAGVQIQNRRGTNPESVPAQYRNRLGRITADTSVPQIRKFMEEGGAVVAIGSSTNLAYHLGLPVRNALVEMTANHQERPLTSDKYYIPGSILRMSVDTTQPAAWGLAPAVDVYFDASPVFSLTPEGIAKGVVKPLAWFSGNSFLRSGWAWGERYLKDGVAAFVAPVGAGKLYAFGPEITFRGQTHGTFKLLFNGLYSID